MKKIISKYEMELYSLKREDLISHSSHLSPDIEIRKPDIALWEQIKRKYPSKYKKWKHAYHTGRIVLAILHGEIIGYGLLKTKGDRDTFYRFGNGTAYLCEFFVDSTHRGKGIYPAMISYLVESNPEFGAICIFNFPDNLEFSI